MRSGSRRESLLARAPALALALVLLAPSGHASSSRSWVLRDRGDFEDVKLDGVSLAPDGSLRPSASVTPLFDAGLPFLWCLARDASGRLYAGGGNTGKVFRIVAGGKPEVVFSSDELEVHAVALDSRGRLYAATSPNGAVYRVAPEGGAQIVFDPEDTYIWALAFDEKGRLYVATGLAGRVYRLDAPEPGSRQAVVLDGREDHIRALEPAGGGALYAGSDQNGIVYRIDAEGRSAVIYDTPMREIAALRMVGGNLYAAALAPIPRQRGGAPSSTAGVTRITVTADDAGGEGESRPGDEDQQDQPSQQRQGAGRPQPESYYGAIYRISSDGYARKLWESREALPLSLAPFDASRLLVGTGNEGRLVLLDEAGEGTEFVAVPSAQVNALIPDGQGAFLAAASNLGQVVRIDPGASQQGSATSDPLDAGHTATWGQIAWNADVAPGASVRFLVRTGNTEEPDGSWSDWSPEYTRAEGSAIERPRARYLQWRALLRGGRDGPGPILRSVQIGYMQDNLPPEVTGVELQPPGVVLSSSGDRGGDGGEVPPGRRPPSQPRRSFEKGRRAVSWKAEDTNDDAVRYDLFFKAEDESSWKPLAKDLEDEFLTWDATEMPDGVYRIRVVATDSPSNPPAAAQSGSRTSAAFDVDNTPPMVGPITVKGRGGRIDQEGAEVALQVADASSPIAEAAYSLDAAEWIPLLPDDRIADTARESYRFQTGPLLPGEHTVTVRARDRAGNTAAGKVVFNVVK